MDEKRERIIRYKAKLAEWDGGVSSDAKYADDILCTLLGVLGYGEVVEMYYKLREKHKD